MAGILTETWGCYEYSTTLGKAVVTWGALTSEVEGYFMRRPLDSLSIRSTPRGKVLYSGDMPLAAESLEALVPLVDATLAEQAKQPRHPAEIVFPALESGESRLEPAREFRTAAESLLRLIEAEAESIAVVYGYINPLRLPHFPDPHWGGRLSGLRLPNDPHVYSLRAELGRLELVQHDPATGRVLQRTDIRSWDLIPSAIGDIRICRQPMDLNPFLNEVHRLVETLACASEETVTIRWQELPDD